jgi:hypothetical protein
MPNDPRHLAALIFACAVPCRAQSAQAGTTTVVSGSAVAIPGLSVTMEVPSRVRWGDSIAIRLVLRNDNEVAIVLPMTFARGFGFDPVVHDASGVLVWRRLAGQYVFADGETRIVQPRQTTEYEATWNLRDVRGALLPLGRYRLTGRLVGGRDSVFVSAVDTSLVITP